MKKKASFSYDIRHEGRPQILLIGNGLERGCRPTTPDPKGRTGQLSWNELVSAVSAEGCAALSKKEIDNVPFPLLYSILSVPHPAPFCLDERMIKEEETRLKAAMERLTQSSTARLDALRELGADHILTTNYNYGLEQVFFPGKDFFDRNTRSARRFNLNPAASNGRQVREVSYRMHTGYLAKNRNGHPVGLWHIHGECTVTGGIVLGHDRYGRLLSRIEKICDSQNYADIRKSSRLALHSWPELFLYGDVYVIGFGFHLSEFDLWWLMKRKQREKYNTGKVYFYERPDSDSVIQKMMCAHGAELPVICESTDDFDTFYRKAFDDIAKRIAEHQKNRDKSEEIFL